MKKLHLFFTFIFAILLTIDTNIQASDRKFITRQIQLGLMESIFNLAHSKNPVTQSDINAEFTKRDINFSDEDKYKAWRFAQSLPLNRDLNACAITCYALAENKDLKPTIQDMECQNMVHNFFQAKSFVSLPKSDK